MSISLEELTTNCLLQVNVQNFVNIKNFLKHIFFAKDDTGYHSEHYNPSLVTLNNIKPIGKNAYNGYRDGKNILSTFFPKDWDEIKIVTEVNSAYDNRVQNISNNGKVETIGLSKSGLYITLKLNYEKKIQDAYPAFSQKSKNYKTL